MLEIPAQPSHQSSYRACGGSVVHVVEAQGSESVLDKQVPVQGRFVQKVLVFKIVEVASSTFAENVERVGENCLRTAGDGWR